MFDSQKLKDASEILTRMLASGEPRATATATYILESVPDVPEALPWPRASAYHGQSSDATGSSQDRWPSHNATTVSKKQPYDAPRHHGGSG